MEINANFLLDSLIAILLLVTIGYCWRLSRKIALLHEGRKDLAHFLAEFNTAIMKAEESISTLREISNSTDEQLGELVQKARFLSNDLSFLVDKGENLADELEGYLTNARMLSSYSQSNRKPKRNTVNNLPSKRQGASYDERNIRNSDEELQLTTSQIVETLKSDNIPPLSPTANSKPMQKQSNMTPSKKHALESVLAQIAARKSAKQKGNQSPLKTQQARGDVKLASETKKRVISTRPQLSGLKKFPETTE